MSMKKEEKRAAFSLAPWKRLWQSIRQHRVRLTVSIGSNLSHTEKYSSGEEAPLLRV